VSLARRIWRLGRATEPARDTPDDPDATVAGSEALAGSLNIREVDAGSCNGCELEVINAFGPVYDAERFGAKLVASPRHADALLVTGPVTVNMATPLRKTYEAMPAPKLVIALGDCAKNCGVFRGGHGIEGSVADVLDVDLEIPGCPPEPQEIIAAIRRLTGR
jgi:Ni,Fe-hydrogenase III small subunit